MPEELFPNESENTPITFREKVSDILSTARNEIRDTDAYGKAIIISAVLMGGYEWGLGNEAVIPLVAGQALDAADGIGGIALSAAIGGGFVFSQQLLSGFLARRTTEQFPSVGNKAFAYANDEEEDLRYKPFRDLPVYKKAIYSLSLGSSFMVGREATVVGNANKETLIEISRKSSAISASTVALFGAGVDIVNQSYEDNDVVQFCIDWGVKNPLFWIGIVGLTALRSRKSAKA